MQMPSLIPAPGSLFDRIMTVVLANILWFVCAVPIITFPAATAGLFAVLGPLVRDKDPEIFATFFGAMRRYWLKSTLIVVADGLIIAAVGVNFAVLDMMQPPGVIFWLFRGVYIFLVIVTLLTNFYLWPLLVLVDWDLKRLVMAAIRVAFTSAIWSGLMLGLTLVPLVVALFVPPAVSILGIFALAALIANWGAWRVLRRYITPEGELI